MPRGVNLKDSDIMEKARILILTLIIVTILSLLIYQPNGKVSEIIIGKNEYGEVIREGPFGDPNSPDRVAYIVGVHPHESQAMKPSSKP